jgi:hypothetical protein
MQKKKKSHQQQQQQQRIMILSQITKYCLPPKGCHLLSNEFK